MTLLPFLVSCSGIEFQGTLAGDYKLSAQAFFPLSTSEINFKQINSFQNDISLHLNLTQVGTEVDSIDKSMIHIFHENQPISNFSLVKSSEQKDQVIDIAFVVDVTASMDKFIEDAKSRLVNFIHSALRNGIRTRMCVSTFGDYTVKKCDRFYDNNPNDTSTFAQTEELISEISKLRALKGAEDPGGRDFDENPMQAIVDVSKAPFRSEAQKFVILVTDAGFLYAPQNPGTLGNKAQTMEQVATAIKNSQITIFGITPVLPGYTSSLNGVDSIVEKSGGEHFLFQSVMNGSTNLNQILDRVLDRVKSTYVLTYTLDDYSKIDLEKPVNFNNIKVEVKENSSIVKIEDIKYQASFPEGRPSYIQEWTFAYDDVDVRTVQVFINNKQLNPTEYLIRGGVIKMKTPPALASSIVVKFKYLDESKNIRLKPVFLNRIVDENQLNITLNGVPARPQDLVLQRDLNNDLSIMIRPEALATNYYLVKENQGVFLDIQ